MDICRCTVQELISFSFTGEWSPGSQEIGDQCWRIIGNAEYPGISFGKSLESLAGKQNTGKFVESLVYIRIVNHRPDDECQRACGVYRSVDEGQQVQVIKTQVTGIW